MAAAAAGPPRRPARGTLLAVAAVTVAVVALAVVFLVLRGGDQRVTVETRAFTLAPTQATLVFAVTRPAGTPVSCDLRARDVASAVVGRTTGVAVPVTAARTVVLTGTVPLSAPATVVEVESCTRRTLPAR